MVIYMGYDFKKPSTNLTWRDRLLQHLQLVLPLPKHQSAIVVLQSELLRPIYKYIWIQGIPI